MTRTAISLLLAASAAPLMLGCEADKASERIEPTFIYVELLEDQVGSQQAPLPFNSEPFELQVRVSTLDINGEPYTDFNGDLTLDIRPGDVEQDPKVELVDGRYEGPVTVKNGFGPTRIWFSDLGDKDVDSGRPVSYATGVSDEIWYHLPTVAEMNQHHDHETNQLDGEFAELRVDDRDLRVSAVGADGFWVLDLLDPPGGHGSMFIYTFSAPEDEVQVGRRLSLLNGNNQEYLATTQLSFPHYEVSEEPAVEMPEPALLDWELCGNSDVLEGYEGAVVRLEGARVPSSFVEGSEEYTDYIEYGQWPIEPASGGDGCTFYVENGTSIPGLFPTDHIGEEMSYVQGMLLEIWGTWILLPRDEDDVPPSFRGEGVGGETARRARRPVPRHRPEKK